MSPCRMLIAAADEQVTGTPPDRHRTDLNPLHRAEYLLQLSWRAPD